MPTKIQKIRCKSKKKSVKYNRPQGLQSEAAQEGQRTKVVIAQRFACKEMWIKSVESFQSPAGLVCWYKSTCCNPCCNGIMIQYDDGGILYEWCCNPCCNGIMIQYTMEEKYNRACCNPCCNGIMIQWRNPPTCKCLRCNPCCNGIMIQ